MGNKFERRQKESKHIKQNSNASSLNKDSESTIDSLDLSQAEIDIEDNTSSLLNQQYKSSIDINDFKIEKQIGTGAFSKVYLLKNKENYYALKAISKAKSTEKSIDSLRNEKKIMEMISHPFLAQFYGSYQDEENIYFLMDYIKGKELYYVLKEHKHFSEKETKFYLAEIFSVLQYLHSHNIIYRDLKAENIIIDSDGHIKLIDFGISKILSKKTLHRTNSFKGTFEYIPPEAINQNASYSFGFDWWSFGVLMYKMLTGKFPFESKDATELLYSIKYKEIDIMNDKHLKKVSGEGKDLLRRLLTKKEEEKINCDDIIEHAWFKSVNFGKVENKEVKAPIKPKLSHKEKQLHNVDTNIIFQNGKNNDKNNVNKAQWFKGF